MFCTNCGNEIPTGGRFCVTCGRPVKRSSIPPTPPDHTTQTSDLNSDSSDKDAMQSQISEELSEEEMFSQVSDALAKENFDVSSETQIPNNNPYVANNPTYHTNQNSPNNIFYQENIETPLSQNSQTDKKKRSVLLPVMVCIAIFAIVTTVLLLNKDRLFSSKTKTDNQTASAANTSNKRQDTANEKNNNKKQDNTITEETEAATKEPEPTKTPEPTSDPEGIHSYKVKKGDVTWKEANSAAKGDHSHLATANSEKEWKAILKVAKKAQKTKGINVFWIGAKRNQYEDTYYWQDSVGNDLYNNPHWMDGEPSYYDSSVDKEEYYVELMYIKSSDSWVLNDAPNSITAWYSGKIGYIVETEDE